MKTVTKYVADDGTEFFTPGQAHEHDGLVARCAAALAPLGPRREIPHGKYVQHSKEAVNSARSNLLVLIREKYSDLCPEVLTHADDAFHPQGGLCRLLDDSGPIARAWGRISRINFDDFREYDQPYFAMNPSKSRGHA